jgi:hypothetical protein
MNELTENQWQIAHAIARQLVQDEADVNELKKALAYLRTCVDLPNAGERFFKYLQNLIHSGGQIGHSKKTIEYYRSLNQACEKYLKPLQDAPQVMLAILGWAGQLAPYYKTAPIAELMTAAPVEVESIRQAERRQAAKAASFQVGQGVEATIAKIDGNKVTYQLPGELRLTQKEPRRFKELTVEQQVQVEITELREDGVPKKVKLLDSQG